MANINDDDLFEGFEEEPSGEPEEPQESQGNNRKFTLVLGILGVIFFMAVVAMAVVAAIYLPARNAARQQQVVEINAANTATALAATQFAYAQQEMLTPSATAIPSATQKPSPTAVIVQATPTSLVATSQGTVVTTGTAEPAGAVPKDLLSRTQTVAVLLTQAAQGYSTAAAAGTALPETGFADEVGLPGLVGLAAVLVVVIIAVRRIRFSGHD